MNGGRTDLAVEAKELFEAEASALPGVESRQWQAEGYDCDTVKITSSEGAEALGKPMGIYHTLDLTDLARRERNAFRRGAEGVRSLLAPLIPAGAGTVLVVGLGNRAMTPDAVGAMTADGILVTRHLIKMAPEQFGDFRSVAVCATGVLGTTGIESGEMAAALCEKLRPQAVIAVDALCARRVERLCVTVQISDTGIVPGSGVGNHRYALDRESLGVPVIAVGVPTVIEGAALRAEGERASEESAGARLFVTPRDIDGRVKEMARVLAYGISLALQPTLTMEELELLTE